MSDFKRPISIIGAGSVVEDGHLPGYRNAGFEITGIFDIKPGRAAGVAKDFLLDESIVYDSVNKLVESAPQAAVFDLALPPLAIVPALEQIPDGRAVLMQKPMGENLEQARKILEVCKRRKLTAGVNFSLRFSPSVQAMHKMIQSGEIGEIQKAFYHVVRAPEAGDKASPAKYTWEFVWSNKFWRYVYWIIHHVDMMRLFFDDPVSVCVKTEPGDPGEITFIRLKTGSGREITYRWGISESWYYTVGIHGSKGVVRFKLDGKYPHNGPDLLKIGRGGPGDRTWQIIDEKGAWFPDGFQNSMTAFMRHLDDPVKNSYSSLVDNAIRTMAVVDALIISGRTGTEIAVEYP
jgi:predicted dehydrogenase